MIPSTHTIPLFASFDAAIRHYVLTEGFQPGQDTEARIATLTGDFFDMDLEEIEEIIAEHRMVA